MYKTMNIQTEKMNDFLNELLREQSSLSQKVQNFQNFEYNQELLKYIKDINQVITLVYGLQKSMQKSNEKSKETKSIKK